MNFEEQPYNQSENNVQQEAKPTELQILEMNHREIMLKLVEMEKESNQNLYDLSQNIDYINLAKKEREIKEKLDKLKC